METPSVLSNGSKFGETMSAVVTFKALNKRVVLKTTLRRQTQTDLREFEASLVYRAGSRTARTVTQRNPVSKSVQD